MLIVENTEETRATQRVTATMAIEDMYFDKEFLKEIIKCDRGERTLDDLLKEVISQYAR